MFSPDDLMTGLDQIGQGVGEPGTTKPQLRHNGLTIASYLREKIIQ